MTKRRDGQRQRVYAWEDRIVAPAGGGTVRRSDAQAMVAALWQDLGLRYPPRVEPLPPQARRRLADANRTRLRLPEELPCWVLLHELAHALSSTADEQSDGHGPVFMGLYVQLLQRYLRMPEETLIRTLDQAGIRYHLNARPVFVDASLT